jgi:hypothetical protein
VKVQTSDFTRVGALTLNSGENNVIRAVLDIANDTGYFATQTNPSIIVKVTLSTLTRVGALTLNSGENGVRASAIDTTNGFAYFGTNTSPGIVVKIQLSDFTRVGAVILNSGENSLFGAAIDTANSHLYFITRTTPGGIVKLSTTSFTRLGGITFNSGENPTEPAILDVANGLVYTAAQTTPGKVIKIDTNHTGFIFGNKAVLAESGNLKQINFYSHTASGNLRLALYNSNKTLLWESGSISNTAAGTIIPVPVEQGTPTVLNNLDAGTYYVAFQQTSNDSIASYTAGSSGDGWYYAQSFGAFPASISGETSTSELYAAYASYGIPSTPSNSPSAVVPTVPAQNPPQLVVNPPNQHQNEPQTSLTHALGTEIRDASGTIYTIIESNGVLERRAYTSAASYLSYSFNSFGSSAEATLGDAELPLGAFIPPRDGSVICSDRGEDKGTCYLMSEGKKRGIPSETLFTALGFSFNNALTGDVSFLPQGVIIGSPSETHPTGTLINNGGTLQIVGHDYLIGFPDLAVLHSWGYRTSDAVAMNVADSLLAQTKVLPGRQAGQISISY